MYTTLTATQTRHTTYKLVIFRLFLFLFVSSPKTPQKMVTAIFTQEQNQNLCYGKKFHVTTSFFFFELF